jgi:hypothetical protein
VWILHQRRTDPRERAIEIAGASTRGTKFRAPTTPESVPDEFKSPGACVPEDASRIEGMVLRASTGDGAVDDILEDVIAAYSGGMPGAVRGFYVAGSYAEGMPVPASDIDLVAVLRDGADEEFARQIAETCASRSPIRLDLVPVTIAALAARFQALVPSFKQGTLLVFGEDVRDEIQLPPLAAFAEGWADRARSFMARIRRVEALVLPPEYPDPAGEFFGYDRATISPWYPPGTRQSTKELVAIVGSGATALIATRGAYVPSKGKCAPMYEEFVGDNWTGLVRDVHDYCRGRFHYSIPDAEDDRRTLRRICEKVLAFETVVIKRFGT